MPSLKELLAAKQQAPAAPPSAKPKGIIARADPVGSPPPPPPPSLADVRPLGQPVKGEDVPFEFPSETSSGGARLCLEARQLPETSLGIALEPGETSSHAWIVLESQQLPGKLLWLFRLPLKTPASPGAPY
jgi:hypothetical protein